MIIGGFGYSTQVSAGYGIEFFMSSIKSYLERELGAVFNKF